MNGGPWPIVAATVLAILLLIAAASDLRSRIIPNWLNLAIALTAPLAWLAMGLAFWPDIAWQIGAAAAVFALFVAMFAFNAIGGGDVKLIGALALWIRPGLLPSLLLIMALIGGVIAAAMLIHRKINKTGDVAEVPYGVAIAIAGLWAIHEQFVNHFPPLSTH